MQADQLLKITVVFVCADHDTDGAVVKFVTLGDGKVLAQQAADLGAGAALVSATGSLDWPLRRFLNISNNPIILPPFWFNVYCLAYFEVLVNKRCGHQRERMK